ncbi:MAG TPA: ABC transporter permease [Puia sp.]|nr:ABC transporter permease [Puia sp.]
MLKNYLTIIFRTLIRSRLYSIVNIGGLAVGLASFIVILVYLNYESGYDKWDPSLTKVYKVSLIEEQEPMERTPAPLALLLAQHYANAQAATSIMASGDYEVLLGSGTKQIYQKDMVEADSSFFKVFPYKLIRGDAATALDAPNAAVISGDLSRKLFGNADPVGKTIKVYNAFDVVVHGILQQPGGPSHLGVQIVLRAPYEKQNMFWENHSFTTYLRLKHAEKEVRLENGINEVYYDARLKKDGRTLEQYRKTAVQGSLFTDAVGDLHNFPKYGKSRWRITMVLLILAVFLLVAASINFSNLSVAKAVTRAKEVGVRKALGSGRAQIIWQSLLEITIQCLISLTLAVLLVDMALPYFSRSFGLPLSFTGNAGSIPVAVQIAATLVLIILACGLYPALFLSDFRTSEVLKGNYNKGSKGLFFRNTSLVIQLTLSALFITGTIVIYTQMRYMQHRDIGFSGSQVIRIEATQKSREGKFQTIRNSLLSIPGVERVAKSTVVPGSKFVDTSTHNFGYGGKRYRLNTVKVSADYFRTMEISLLDGRLFDDGHHGDLDNTAIINESAMKLMTRGSAHEGEGNVAGAGDGVAGRAAGGGASPVGQLIRFPGCDTLPYTIVGVVKDFNAQGFESRIEPAVYSISNAHCGYQSGGAILVRIRTGQVQKTLAGISAFWKTAEPDFPIRYSFLDQDFQKLFIEYDRLEKIILFFTLISILIAAIGLFALTSFLTQQRVKEIGIRRVLGASVASITTLLSGDFVRLVIVAIFISMPVAWWALSKWLEDFAYRIDLSWWMFAAAGFLTVGITLITVGFQAIKAALANPAESLRTE